MTTSNDPKNGFSERPWWKSLLSICVAGIDANLRRPLSASAATGCIHRIPNTKGSVARGSVRQRPTDDLDCNRILAPDIVLPPQH